MNSIPHVIRDYSSVPSHEPSTAEAIDDSITLNATVLHSCEASENGIPCWRHADEVYHTKAFTMDGVFYPSEERHLCKICYRRTWQIMLVRLKARVMVEAMIEMTEAEKSA